MTVIKVQGVGAIGVNKDLSSHELPNNAWTDASNIRFLDGYAYQFLGHGSVYDTPPVAPQYVMPIYVAGVRYWLYATAGKQYVVTNTGGSAVHTDITHATPRTGVVNQWTGTMLGGIPILNSGDTTHYPMYWDQVLANKFVNLSNWPANTYCKSLRSYKNFLIAMNVTKSSVNYPMLFKWSSPAVAGALPTTWDENDETNDAGEFDIPDGQDPIVDGLGLKESFIVYKESSTYRVDYTGSTFVFQNKKVFGMSGLMNRGCAVEFDSFHFAVTGSDVVIHDGYNATSVLDKADRRFFFQDIDATYRNLVFCFKNPFMNEIFIAYPAIGSTVCDKALVYNYADKTVSFRTLPNVNHAAYGAVDNSLGGNWSQDSDPWDSDVTLWGSSDFTPDTARVIMGSASIKLYMLDASASFDGVLPVAYMERRGLSFGAPESMWLVSGIRPRISGNLGGTVIVKIGYADTPYADPTYTSMTYTIGTTLQCDCFVSGRYISVRFETGTAYQWRLDSYDLLDVQTAGMY